MANIFAAITAVLLAASMYVAYKNQQAFENEISNSRIEKDRLDTSRQRLADLRAEKAATIEEREGVESDTVAKQEIEAQRDAGNKKLDTDIASKKEQVKANATKIAEIEDQTKEQGELRDLADKIRRLKTEIAGLEDEKANNEAKLANLLDQKASTEGTIKDYREVDQSFAKQQSFFKSARISSIFAPWGFVTLDAGNTAGVVTGSTLEIVRDGESIGKLRVRSVESSRAAADIIPGSMAEDVTLMVGDRVVPAAPAEPAKPKEEAPAAAPADEAPAADEGGADELDFDL